MKFFINTILTLTFAVPAHAQQFTPVTDLSEVTAGLAYDTTQPPVDDPQELAGKRVAILGRPWCPGERNHLSP